MSIILDILITQPVHFDIKLGSSNNFQGTSEFMDYVYEQSLSASAANWAASSYSTPDFTAEQSQKFPGSASNWGSQDFKSFTQSATDDEDYGTSKGYAKATLVYYKLRGYYPATSQYETWVVTEDLTTHSLVYTAPTQFSELTNSINLTPPSGHALTDIVLIKRWIE